MATGILNLRGGTTLPATLEERELFLLFDDTTNDFKQLYAGPSCGEQYHDLNSSTILQFNKNVGVYCERG